MGAQGEQPPFKISFGEPRIVTADERAHLEGQGHVVQPIPQKKEFIESGGRPVVANKWTQTSAKKLLNERDPIGAPRQEWAVVSVVIPGDTTTEQAKADKLCIKVAGCFETGEAATRFMQDLYAKRPYLDLHCIQTGYLVPFPVDDETRRHIKHYSEDPVAQEVMNHYHSREFAERERQLGRMADVKESAAQGLPGAGHTDMPDLDPAEITFEAAKDVGKVPPVIDPLSDDPKLLESK